MSDSILSGDFEVYYTDEASGDKQIVWTGSATGMRTVLELYQEIQNLFDNDTGGVGDHMEEGIPMSAQTPTEFTLGQIETNDAEPWFINEETMKHLQGGSITTSGWERDRTGHTNIGIIKFDYTFTTNFDPSDIGDTITSGDGDSGTLLDFHQTVTGGWEAHVRPDSSTAADDWDSSTTVTGGSSSGVTMTGVPETGESLWASVFSLGTLASNTDIYIIQDYMKIESWWSSGQIDVLILIFEAGNYIDPVDPTDPTGSGAILTIFARQYGMLYDHYVLETTGGRNPIPLSTSDDINNDTGYRTMSISGATGNYTLGEVISNGTNASGIVTAETGDPTTTLFYYLIGDLTDFSSSQTITGASSGVSGTSGSPSNTGPATVSGVTFTYGATQQDIGDGDGDQPYDVLIDLGAGTLNLDDFYEYTKYITRRAADEPILSAYGHEGEQYITVGEIRISYENQSAAFTEGAVLTGQTSGATAVIIADHNNGDNTGTLIVGDVRGTFDDTTPEEIQDDATPGIADIVSGGLETTILSKVAPFGTFAGGKFFGARGVWIQDMHADDSNNYQLIDSNGVVRTPPATISIAVNGVIAGDRVAVFRATGDNNTVEKSQFTIQQAHSTGVAYIRVSESIPLDTPNSGDDRIRVVRRDGSGNIIGEERYTYTAWSNANQPTYSEFTLSGTTTEDYDTDDTAYVPYLDEEATGTSVSKSIQYVTTRFVTVRVRRKGILPFIIKGSITSSGFSATAIRTNDTIVD